MIGHLVRLNKIPIKVGKFAAVLKKPLIRLQPVTSAICKVELNYINFVLCGNELFILVSLYADQKNRSRRQRGSHQYIYTIIKYTGITANYLF